MKKEILFITATHGNERIGISALKQLGREEEYDWIIGNERAFLLNERFTEKDLNRSAPGDINSKTYELRRSAEIITKANQYKYCIDIHGTDQPTGIFTIITNPTEENFRLSAKLPIDRIVIWPSTTPEMKYPNSEFFSCGLEIECGPKDDYHTVQALAEILNDFLDKVSNINDTSWINTLKKKTFFIMTDSMKSNELPMNVELKEFEDVIVENKVVTPIFIGTYPYSNVIAYKMKRLLFEEIHQRYLRQ